MSSSLLLSNWLEEVAFERQVSSSEKDHQGACSPDINHNVDDEAELSTEVIRDYQEADLLCPFNLREQEHADSSHPDLSISSNSTASKQTSNLAGSGSISANCLSSTQSPCAVTPEKQKLNVLFPKAREAMSKTPEPSSEKEDQTTIRTNPEHHEGATDDCAASGTTGTNYGGLSPDYRSRKSSTTQVTDVAGPFGQLTSGNLDQVSRKAYYSPRHSVTNTATVSPCLTAASSPRRRCWVDLPDETAALLQEDNGRLRRTSGELHFPAALSRSTSGMKQPHRLSGALTPAPEFRLGSPVMMRPDLVVPGPEVSSTAVSSDGTASSSEMEDEEEVHVVSWIDNEDEEDSTAPLKRHATGTPLFSVNQQSKGFELHVDPHDAAVPVSSEDSHSLPNSSAVRTNSSETIKVVTSSCSNNSSSRS